MRRPTSHRHSTRWLVPLCALLFVLGSSSGCKAPSHSYAGGYADATAAPGGYEYDYNKDAEAYDGGAAGGYSYGDDTVEAEMMVREEAAPARSRGGKFKEKRWDRDEAPAPAAPPTDVPQQAPQPTLQPTTGETTVNQPEPEPAEQQESEARKVVYTASLSLKVWKINETLAFAETLTDRYGGWIQSRYDAQITLRVPADRLTDAIAELSKLGTVVGKTLQADDVTAEYVDLESRLAVLEHMEKQLLALLAQAKTIEESLKVRQELDRVRMELEIARARMRELGELVSFSTLTLYLIPESPIGPTPSSNDPFPWVNELGVEATEFI